jgi:hypothetical protein
MDIPSRRRRAWRASGIGVLILLGLSRVDSSDTVPGPRVIHFPRNPDVPGDRVPTAPEWGRPSPLPLPGRVSLSRFERELFEFLNARRYVELGWLRDKRVRDTGPYLAGKSYGTHPAVRVYYSPGVIRWLKGGRAGTIPDGEMIIKEQYAAPAIRHEGKTEE